MPLNRFRPLASASAVLGALALAACIPPSPEPTPAPTPSPVAQPEPQQAPPVVLTPTYDTWMDAPQSAGDWRYVASGSTTRALFGEGSQGARLSLTCDRASRRVTLARAGSASGQVEMLVRTETQDRRLTAAPVTGGTPEIAAVLSSGDTLLDAIAFSKGRFAVETPGAEPLYAPAYPEISRVIEDCRR